MARLLLILFVSALAALFNICQTVQAADAVSNMSVKELIVKHSREMNLDPAIALSIAKAESNYCHNKTSRGGAVGVFQLMPSTAKRMGYDPYSLHDNIKGGIEYYKKMYKMFGTIELALAAYNAGPGNVKKYNGIPPFGETKHFVSAIMKDYKKIKAGSDPAIDSYDSKIKEINNKIAQDNFRKKQEKIIQAYLSALGV